MKCEKIYNHLNAVEFLSFRHPELWQELLQTIKGIDANKFLKYSEDKTKKGEILYSQSDINDEFELQLFPKGWYSTKTPYYVSEKPELTQELVKLTSPEDQKSFLDAKGEIALDTFNQVDFVKDKIAVEVQFGKYFSVAYDLHVKHTFFYSLGTINVGIEIIPTHEFEMRMDTGVAWWENEVANVIREGRSNPSVPIVIIGIEPEVLIPLPDANSRKKVNQATKKRDGIKQSLREAKQIKSDIEQSISSDLPEKEKVRIQKKLAKADATVNHLTESLREAEKNLQEAIKKNDELTAFKESAKETISSFNSTKKERSERLKGLKDEIRKQRQKAARQERAEKKE